MHFNTMHFNVHNSVVAVGRELKFQEVTTNHTESELFATFQAENRFSSLVLKK